MQYRRSKIKLPALYAYYFTKSFDIVCLQEHSTYEFQRPELEKHFKEKETFIQSSDMNEKTSSFNLHRGKGGLVIAYLTSKITRLDKGKDRIM